MPVLVATLIALLAGCASDTPRVDAPEPESGDAAAPIAPTLPPSRLDVPISVDLSDVVEDLEKVVPRTFGDLEKRSTIRSNDRVDVAWEVERSDFQAELDGDTGRITTLIRYRARAWYDPPIAPTVSASCGTADDHDDRPTALVAVSSKLRIDSDWILRSTVNVDTIRPASQLEEDECRITFLRIDVTGQLMEAASDLLKSQSSRVDSLVATIDLRSKFTEWWDLIRTPIELTDSIWLVIDPVAVRRGTVGGSGLTLEATVGLTATPRIVIGRRPPEPQRPLPQLEDGVVDPGLHILIEGHIEYPTISHIIDEELAGRTFERAGQSIRVTELRLSGLGVGRLALRVDFTGDAAGHVYFVGTPVYDPISGLVSVPDLDFDVASSSLLVEGLDWLRHAEFLDWIRDKARWPVDDAIAEGRRLLLDGLNRNLSESVRLSGEVQSVTPLAVLPGPSALRVQAHARATANLTVK